VERGRKGKKEVEKQKDKEVKRWERKRGKECQDTTTLPLTIIFFCFSEISNCEMKKNAMI
jgi:hypothetical protein